MNPWDKMDQKLARGWDRRPLPEIPHESSRGEIWTPTDEWGVGLVMIGLVLTVAGGYGIYHRKNLGLSVGALAVGLIVMAFCLQPLGLHFHPVFHPDWMWVVPIGIIWAVAKFRTATTIDDKAVKAWVFIVLVAMLALRGLFVGMTPASTIWWVGLLVWTVAISEAIIAGMTTRPFTRNCLLVFGWYFFAVLA